MITRSSWRGEVARIRQMEGATRRHYRRVPLRCVVGCSRLDHFVHVLPDIGFTLWNPPPAASPKHRMGFGLLGDNLLLNLRQQQLRFGQRQT